MVVNAPYALNFHHFLLETVPRFAYVKAAGINLDEIDYFIFPDMLFRWHTEVIDMLRIDRKKIICNSPNLHLEFEKLIVPSYFEQGIQSDLYDYTMMGLKFVRKLFLNQRQDAENSFADLVYISRERAKERRLQPITEAENVLESLGFTTYFAEDLSLREQAALFHQARCVIMATGGNLANAVFMRPNTTFIELFSPYYMPSFSLAFVHNLNLAYHVIVGDRERRSPAPSEGAHRDIFITMERLKAEAGAIIDQ